MTALDIDVAALDDEQLAALLQLASAEDDRRRTIATAARMIDGISTRVYDARGGDGQAWRQPTGAHDCYPLGAMVTHNGSTWKSLNPANVWEPGIQVAGLWEAVTTEPTPDVTETPVDEAPPEWAAGQSVAAGDKRTWKGATYVCIQPHATLGGWEPPNVPALWSIA